MGTESGIRNMTVGSPFRHILMFTLPLLAGNFLQQFYNMVDSWVVGNYVSDGALAAVGVGFPVIFLFTSLFSGIATGGTVVILGRTGKNFAAGMSGGVAYVLDENHDLYLRVNKQMVEIEKLTSEHDMEALRGMIEAHVRETGSEKGRRILENFDASADKFKKIIPRDYRRMLSAIARCEAQGMSRDEAELEAFRETTEGR